MTKTDKRKNRKNAGALWPLLLGYLSTVLAVVLAGLIVVAGTVCSPAFMQRQVNKSAFAAAVYTLLEENYASYAAATGFDAEVLTDVISETQIEADMRASVADMYAGETAFDTRDEVSSAAYEAMAASLAQRGIEVTDTVDGGIELVADACRSDYASYVSVPLASQLYTAISKIKSLLWMGIVSATIFLGAALVLMLRLSPNAKTGVHCLIYTFTAAAVLCLLVATALYPAMNFSALKLDPTSMRLLVLQYVRSMLGSFGIFAAIYGAVAALLAVLNGMALAKARQRAKNISGR